MVNILKEHYSKSLLTPSPSDTNLKSLEFPENVETLEALEKNDLSKSLKGTESHEDMSELSKSQNQDMNPENKITNESTGSNDLKDLKDFSVKNSLLDFLSAENVEILESQDLLHWNLLVCIEFKEFKDLGLNMNAFLKLKLFLKGIYNF